MKHPLPMSLFTRRAVLAQSLRFGIVAATGALTLSAPIAQAQDFPNRAIRFVVPYAAGATLDTIGRVVGQELSRISGQSVVVENKPGADAIIGFEYVARQVPADGYTITMAAVSGLATLPLTVKNLRFDPLKDLPPLVGLVEGKYVLAIPAALPHKNFKEFVDYAKANPGKLNYGASSTTVRLQTEALKRALGLDIVYVPYKSGATYLQAIAGGEIQLGFAAEGSIRGLGARARAVAVTGDKRTSSFPDAPTFAELGLPTIQGVSYSVNVRAGTPKPIADKLEAMIIQAMRTPGVQAQMQKMGLDPVAHPSNVAAERLASEHKLFAGVAKAAGIQPE